MIRQNMIYGAVTTKARAKVAKCLTQAQWEQLSAAASIWAVREILQSCPGWQAVTDVPQNEASAGRLIQALEEQLARDVRSLGLYLPKTDRLDMEKFARSLDQGMGPEEFQKWWAGIGKGNMALRRIAGAEADGLNLVYILRLRRFPASKEEAAKHLIPVREKLKPELVRALLRARNDEEVLAILAGTAWGKTFTSLAPGDLEKQYRAYMRTFCAHLLTSGQPGVGAALAFLVLKHDELSRLRQVIGAVEQGIEPRLVL